MKFSRVLCGLTFLLLLVSGCSAAPATEAVAQGTTAKKGAVSELRSFTGAHTRLVWVQGDGTDPETESTNLVLMGLDSDDGRGERVIVSQRRSIVKPRFTSRADRVVFSSRILPGPPEIFVVNWDGSGLRKLADGFAMALWRNPADGTDWVYAGTENKKYAFAKVTRFPIDAPEKRELVWDTTLVSMEGFNVTPDGRYAGGLWPWPGAGVADLRTKTWKKFGEGCWTGLTYARGPIFWYFDGAHRNVTMIDVDAGTRWMVNLNSASGFDGAEVSHPRWTNHPRFFAITGPYNQGGANQVRSGGKQVEVYLGRFSPDFATVESWLRVTKNSGGDSHPDVWMDVANSPYPRQPAGPIGPPHARAAKVTGSSGKVDAGRVVMNVRLKRPGTIPNPQAILPYRHGLVVNEYEIMDVIQGAYPHKEIRIAQWAIRDSKILPDARKVARSAFTLAAERYDAHPELEGERLLSDSESSKLPLYYDVTRP
jgi:hypothetical protein